MKELDYLLIDRKIDGQLDIEEEQRFVRKLQQDADFAEAYELQMSAIAALRSQQHHTDKQEVKKLYETVKARQQKRRQLYFYAVVASVALLMITSAIYMFYLRPESPETLYTEYYTPYPADPLLRGGETSPFTQASELYRQEDYLGALPYWQEALQEEGDDRIRLFLANCYLQTDQSESAIGVLQPLSTALDAVVQQHGQWYLALSYLKADQLDSAQQLLQNIDEKPGFYQTTAHELLAKLP